MHRITSSAIFVKKAPLVLSRSLHQGIAAPTASPMPSFSDGSARLEDAPPLFRWRLSIRRRKLWAPVTSAQKHRARDACARNGYCPLFYPLQRSPWSPRTPMVPHGPPWSPVVPRGPQGTGASHVTKSLSECSQPHSSAAPAASSVRVMTKPLNKR